MSFPFINIFRQPSIDELMARELEQAHRGLLEASKQHLYYKNLTQYYLDRIHQLNNDNHEQDGA